MNLSSVMVSKYLFRKKPLRLFRPEVSILTKMIVSEPNAIVVITTTAGEPTNKMDRNLTTDVTFNPLKWTCFLRGLLSLMGTSDINSTPPAIAVSHWPLAIRPTAVTENSTFFYRTFILNVRWKLTDRRNTAWALILILTGMQNIRQADKLSPTDGQLSWCLVLNESPGFGILARAWKNMN